MSLVIDNHTVSQKQLNVILDARNVVPSKQLSTTTHLPEGVVVELRRRISDEGLRLVPALQNVFSRKSTSTFKQHMGMNMKHISAAKTETKSPNTGDTESITDQIIRFLGQARTLKLPADIRQDVKIEKSQLTFLLSHLTDEALILKTVQGTVTLSEKGIERYQSLTGKDVCQAVKARIEHYRRNPDALVSSAPQPKPSTPEEEPKPTTSPAKGKSLRDVFEPLEITDNGARLLFKLMKSLTSDHLVEAGFTDQDIDQFGDVYMNIKCRAMATEDML